MKESCIPIKDIIGFLDEYLDSDTFQDYCKNGLQIYGHPICNGIIGGVSISLALIREAVRRNINTILVHHGLIWKNTSLMEIRGPIKERLKLILENDINLIGYHLPLDAHPVIGNNISIIQLLDKKSLKELIPFDSGFRAVFDPPLTKNDIERKFHRNNTSFVFHPSGKEFFSTIIAVSGGSSRLFESISSSDADLFIAGEIKESSYRLIEEVNVSYIALGHYNSETFGVKNLCCLLEKEFALYTKFIDIPNPY